MRVCHFNTYTEGGAAKAAWRIHESIKKMKPDSDFFALYKEKKNDNRIRDFRDTQDWMSRMYHKGMNYIHQYRPRKIRDQYGEWFSEINSVWNVNDLVGKENWDVLHLHWISGFINIPEFVKKHNKKVVWTLHDHFPFSGGFHYPVKVEDEQLNSKIRLSIKKLQDIFHAFPIEIVCPSAYLRALAESSGVFQGCNFNVIKNPVDHQIFRPINKSICKSKFGIPENAKVVFFPSDHVYYKRKGFDLLNQSLQMHRGNTVLLVAGEGEVPVNIGNVVVKHFGKVRDENMMCELYNAADVLVNPTLNDISSNTVIEAAACGVPSVVFPGNGVTELIQDYNGIVAKQIDAYELNSAIERALENKWDQQAILEWSKQEHGLEVIGASYLKVYHSINEK